jgi:hypothetical protein
MQEQAHYCGEFESLLVHLDLSLLQPMAAISEVIYIPRGSDGEGETLSKFRLDNICYYRKIVMKWSGFKNQMQMYDRPIPHLVY